MILGYATMEWAIEKYAHFPPEIVVAADGILTGTNIITRSRAGWLHWKPNESPQSLTDVLGGGGQMAHGGA